jgi:hypothetical protein
LTPAERAVVETAIKRHLAGELLGPWATAHDRAVAELLRLRAAQESGQKDGCVDPEDIAGGRCRLTSDGGCKKGLDCPLMRGRFG